MIMPVTVDGIYAFKYMYSTFKKIYIKLVSQRFCYLLRTTATKMN